ncbi:MAG: FG-GAP repeat protein [Verrucomicrobia bacterium]|nr:FG-GAP repeat protein [Verrucomicrobiota bacterium]
MRTRVTTAILTSVIVSVSATLCGAADIAIQNHSFESPDISAGVANSLAPDSWTISGTGQEGQMDRNGGSPASSVLETPDTEDAEQLVWSNAGHFWQVLSEPLAADTTYILTVDVGDRSTATFDGAELFLGAGSALGENLLTATEVINPTPVSNWKTWSSTFVTGQAPAGEGDPLRIELRNRNIGQQVLFDRVRLTAVPNSFLHVSEKKLIASDGEAGHRFGFAVSLSGDTALIGAYQDDDLANGAGSAYIYQKNAGGTNAWDRAAKLLASDGAAADEFGRAVAIDGDVALVGADGDDDNGNNSGSAYIFERAAGGTNAWGEVAKLTASDGTAADYFATAVAIDGDVAVIGAYQDAPAGSRSGSAYVFERNAGGTNAWGQVAKLTASDAGISNYFGYAVSVEGDVVIVGAYVDDDSGWASGSAYVFERNAGGTNAWGEVAKLTAADGSTNDYFGFSVSVDGDTALIGAFWDDDMGENSGSAYLFERNAGGTNTWGQVAKLTASDGSAHDHFGYSASIEGDVALVSAVADNSPEVDAGSVYIFKRNAGGSNAWGQVRQVTASDGAEDDFFGYSVSADGDAALIGACFDDDAGGNSGSAYVLPLSLEEKQFEQRGRFTASDTDAGDLLGRSVSIDGGVALVGAHGTDGEGNYTGAGYILERNAGGTNAWGQLAKLTASDGEAGDSLGFGGSIDGDLALLSAAGDDYGGTNAGAAYIFERNAGGTNAWGEVAKLVASDADDLDSFGSSVSIAGDVALIGAENNDDVGSSSGSAYVFERNKGGTNAWGEVAKLTASDATSSVHFGGAVSVDGDIAVVGAWAGGLGSAYIYERNAGGTNMWGEVVKLTASDAASGDYFGISVSVCGDVVLVGAHGDDSETDSNSGSAYVFERNAGGTNAWGEVAKLTASDASTNDNFGISVSLDGDMAIVGSFGDDDAGSSSGSAYVFQRNAGGENAWGQVSKLTASDAGMFDKFGVSVAIDGGMAFVGTFASDALGSDSGAAYIFEEFFPLPDEVAVGAAYQDDADNIVLSWPSASPVDYTIQFRDAMQDGQTWTDVTGYVAMPGRGLMMRATNSMNSILEGWYRIKAVNSPLR